MFPVSRDQNTSSQIKQSKSKDCRYGIKNQQNVTLCVIMEELQRKTAVCALCCSSCLAPLEWRDMLFGTA